MTDTVVCQSRYLSQLVVGKLRAKWNAAGTRVLRYYIDLKHITLNLHKELSAEDCGVLQHKLDVLLADWDAKYDAFLKSQSVESGKGLAAQMTIDAERSRAELGSILQATLRVNDVVDWERLKSNDKFRSKVFDEPISPKPKEVKRVEPPKIGFFDKLFGWDKKKLADHVEAVAANEREFQEAVKRWTVAEQNREKRKIAWEAEQKAKEEQFYEKQRATNAKVDDLHQRWLSGDPEAIIEHANLVLDSSSMPDLIQKNFDIAYQPDTGTMLVEYQLPDPDHLPMTKTVRFVTSTGELTETKITQKAAKELYNSIGYQVCLRTIHELYEADTPGFIKSVVFNGFTETTDKATGQMVSAVIMSVMAKRDDFLAIDLARVDPKSCFKSLKGVSAASLAGLAAIPPVMQMNREDKRFIDAREVDLGSEGAINLASMHWEEFEHLVRQLFEKEFSVRGGEVKVTQSSSDGGVDAVAFDPDPITGGKIVIQAKRYTKTVGVAAVRDLYGTVLSEGAGRGILVTTADYGPDAYKFASGKPVTLMSGSHLLHLLEKHGMRAKIDLKAARLELGLTSR